MASEELSAGEVVLGQNNYGKTAVRLVKVRRDTPRHELWDLAVRVALEGDFSAAHIHGDNTGLLATDTMRNVVYALANEGLTGSIEQFGLALVDHFLAAGPTVTRAWVELTQYPWRRLPVDGGEHDHAFERGAGERWARVEGDVDGARQVVAGLDKVTLLKTTASGWEGFHRDAFTTLPDSDDRILATVVTARWHYAPGPELDYDALWASVRGQILTTFGDHYSPSVQNTLFRIGKAVLAGHQAVEKIWLSFPNKHHLRYDLERFGMANEHTIFHATDEPYGQIEGWVERRRP